MELFDGEVVLDGVVISGHAVGGHDDIDSLSEKETSKRRSETLGIKVTNSLSSQIDIT